MKLWGTGDKPLCEECRELETTAKPREQARGAASES